MAHRHFLDLADFSADTLRAICGAIAVNDFVADHTIFEFWNDLPSS